MATSNEILAVVLASPPDAGVDDFELTDEARTVVAEILRRIGGALGADLPRGDIVLVPLGDGP